MISTTYRGKYNPCKGSMYKVKWNNAILVDRNVKGIIELWNFLQQWQGQKVDCFVYWLFRRFSILWQIIWQSSKLQLNIFKFLKENLCIDTNHLKQWYEGDGGERQEKKLCIKNKHNFCIKIFVVLLHLQQQ